MQGDLSKEGTPMLAVVRLTTIYLLLLTGSALAAVPKVVNPKQPLVSTLLNTPLDPLLRSTSMQDSPSDVRSVLAYLRDMVARCREANRRDLMWDYDAAVDLVADRIYGKLPPRVEKNYSFSRAVKTRDITAPFSKSGNAHNIAWSLAPVLEAPPVANVTWTKSNTTRRKIVGRYWKPARHEPMPMEVLECGHEQMGPIGYSILHKYRHCHECKKQKAMATAKKKPASIKIASSKAVSA
jgi:hypothetical protein